MTSVRTMPEWREAPQIAQRDLPRPGLLRPALSLCRRELVRFLRQRHRIVDPMHAERLDRLLVEGIAPIDLMSDQVVAS
jgi:hypothetical protein